MATDWVVNQSPAHDCWGSAPGGGDTLLFGQHAVIVLERLTALGDCEQALLAIGAQDIAAVGPDIAGPHPDDIVDGKAPLVDLAVAVRVLASASWPPSSISFHVQSSVG